jgi:hypothetical protein
MTKKDVPHWQFGPEYDVESAALKKARKAAREGLTSLSKAERQAYGTAVSDAVRASQRAGLRRAGETMPNPNCASRTAHNTGEAIHNAVRAQQRAALLACPSQIRKARKPAEWQAMYDAAMQEKRAREAMPLAA